MTTIKIQGKPRAAAAPAIEARADWLWNHPGGRVVGTIELVHSERSEPAPDEQKDKTVTLSIAHLELAAPNQEEIIRGAQRALYIQRTAVGTLDPDGEVELSEQTLRLLTGELYETGAARSRAALAHWADYARKVFLAANLTAAELRHELQAICDGLYRAAQGLPEEDK